MRGELPGAGLLSPLPPGPRRMLWLLVLLDSAAVAWMISAGDWLDRTSRITSVVTLGGNSHVVLGLALVGGVALGGLAVVTGGFAAMGRWHTAAGAAATAVSVVALAGALSVIGLLVVTVLLIGFVFRPSRPRR